MADLDLGFLTGSRHFSHVVVGATCAGPEVTFVRRHQLVVKIEIVVGCAYVKLQAFEGNADIITFNP